MQYGINFKALINQYLPPLLRKPVRLSLYDSFCQPLKDLHDEFLQLIETIDYDLKYTSETICIEAKLNELFDPILKRIYIITNDDLVDATYIYGRSEVIQEGEVEWLYSRSETVPADDVIYEFGRDEEQIINDFTVHVPSSVLSSSEPKLIFETNKYKAAGLQYNIVTI
jgi:hypothetical protein